MPENWLNLNSSTSMKVRLEDLFWSLVTLPVDNVLKVEKTIDA